MFHQTLTILIIEEHRTESCAAFFNQYVKPEYNFQLIEATSIAQAMQLLDRHSIDVILFDLELLHFTGPFSFKKLAAYKKHAPLIVLASLDNTNIALELIRMGAQDFLIKGQFDGDMILRSIQYSMERKQKEKILLEANERLSIIARVSTDLIWELDLKTNKVVVAQEIVHVGTGKSKKVVEFEEVLNRIRPADRKKIQDTIDEVRRNGAKEIYELEYHISGNDERIVHNRCFVLRDENGNPYKLIGAAKDITKSRKAEEQSKTMEERFRLIFNNNPFPTWVLDAVTYRFLEVNDAAVQKYGYTREEFLNMTGKDIRRPEEVMAFEKELRDIAHYGRSIVKRWTHMKKNGEAMPVEVSAYPFDFLGTPSFLVQVNDLTESMRLKAQLEMREKERQREHIRTILNTEEKERTKIGEELHDNVNQIFATAKLYLEIALDKGDSWREYVEQSKEIINSGIEEIRKLSKDLVTPRFEQTTLIENIEELTDVIAFAGKIRFELDMENFDESRLKTGHKVMLYRIVQEQLNNILKHARASMVKISLKQLGNKIILVVSDNGKGFDVRASRKGIGLSNIQNRVSFYGGRAHIDSAPGKGTKLEVDFCIQ